MIKTVLSKTIETVRERERERVILTKLCFVNYAQKSDKRHIKEKLIINIRNREIGYVNRCEICYV